ALVLAAAERGLAAIELVLRIDDDGRRLGPGAALLAATLGRLARLGAGRRRCGGRGTGLRGGGDRRTDERQQRAQHDGERRHPQSCGLNRTTCVDDWPARTVTRSEVNASPVSTSISISLLASSSA